MILETHTIQGKNGDNLIVKFEAGYFGLSTGGMNFIISNKEGHTRLQNALHAEQRNKDLEVEIVNARARLVDALVAQNAFREALQRIALGTSNPAHTARCMLEMFK